MSIKQQKSAVNQVAAKIGVDFNPTFSLAKSEMNSKTAEHQSVIVEGAIAESVRGLDTMAKIERSLVEACNDPSFSNNAASITGPAADSPGSGMASTIAYGAIGVAGMVIPGAAPVAAAVGVIGAAKESYDFIRQAMGGAEHAGLEHAGVTGGTSTFNDIYTDAEGGTWHMDGSKAANSDLATLKAAPGSGQQNPVQKQAMDQASRSVVAEMGRDAVMDELSRTSREKRQLQQQMGAALNHAEDMGMMSQGKMAQFDPMMKASNNPVFNVPRFG